MNFTFCVVYQNLFFLWACSKEPASALVLLPSLIRYQDHPAYFFKLMSKQSFLWQGYQPSAQPPNLGVRDLPSGATPSGGLASPRRKSSSCLNVVVEHTSSGSSATACPSRVTLTGAYAPAGIAPSFLGTRNTPTTKRWQLPLLSYNRKQIENPCGCSHLILPFEVWKSSRLHKRVFSSRKKNKW
jgi:hypothetical protein